MRSCCPSWPLKWRRRWIRTCSGWFLSRGTAAAGRRCWLRERRGRGNVVVAVLVVVNNGSEDYNALVSCC